MGEKNAHSRGGLIIPWKPLFFFFFLTSALFVLSWFFVLRSTDLPRFVDHNLLPNSRLFVTNDEHIYQPPPPAENNADGEQEEEEERPKDDSTLTLVGLDSKKGKSKIAALKVYMYDLPPEFHFHLLEWKPVGDAVWPDIKTRIPGYPGGLNLQHSIAYWLTLDLLNSEFDHSNPNRAAVRIQNSSEADIIFVPFFSSLTYNRYSKVKRKDNNDIDKVLQGKLVTYLTGQELWKKSGGRDHVIVAHHPNSMLSARMKLWPATFILSDFGRYPPNIANVEKDVIAPYKHVIRNFYNDTSTFDSRKTLLYFQGAIYRKDGGYARQELFYLLKDEKDVHFSFGSVQKDGIRKASEGMHNSKFCLNIAGDTPSSNRLFDAIASHCVPVIISDDIELPYEDVIDYTEFCIFVRTIDAVEKDFLIKLVRSISREEWTKMWHKLKEVEKFFEFNYPSRQGDAVQMIWQAVARKVPAIRFKMHRSNRYYRSGGHRERGLRSVPMPSNFW